MGISQCFSKSFRITKPDGEPNVDRNANKLQRIPTDVDEQEPAQKHMERTTVNIQKQAQSDLSIGTYHVLRNV